jgi:hypothetical protein
VADTLGSLVDKLVTVNIKLYMVQDQVHRAAREAKDLPAEATQKLVTLNRQRTELQREIDQTLYDAVNSGVVKVDPRVKLY